MTTKLFKSISFAQKKKINYWPWIKKFFPFIISSMIFVSFRDGKAFKKEVIKEKAILNQNLI